MKKIVITLAVCFISLSIYCQSEANPFAKYGYDVLTATSSNGEYEEFHDTKDIVEIGTWLYNTKTKEIIGFVKEENTEVTPAITAMSIDPFCEKYYWISPYAYCLNNPIRYIDPDGRQVTFPMNLFGTPTQLQQHAINSKIQPMQIEHAIPVGVTAGLNVNLSGTIEFNASLSATLIT